MNAVCIVLLVLLALLILILLLPVGGRVEFSEDGLTASVRAGPIYYRVYPKREKRTPPEEPKPVTYAVKQAGEGTKPPDEKPPSLSGAAASDEGLKKSADTQPRPEQSETPEQPEQPPAPEQPTDTPPQSETARQPAGKDTPKEAKRAKKPRSRRKKPTKRPVTEQSQSKTGGKLELAMKLAPDLLKLAGSAVHKLRVDELTLDYTIAGRWDAAGAAIQYGTVYATGGVLYPLLEQSLTIKRFHVGAEIDFQEEIPRVYVCLNLSYRVWQLLVLGVGALKLYLKLKKEK